MATTVKPARLTRPLYEIAEEVAADYPAVQESGYYNPALGLRVGQHPANPYWSVMTKFSDLTDKFYEDDGATVVTYFLSNVTTWRGETARRVKAELRAALAHHRQQAHRKLTGFGPKR